MAVKWFLALLKVAHKVLVAESARFHLGGGGTNSNDHFRIIYRFSQGQKRSLRLYFHNKCN